MLAKILDDTKPDIKASSLRLAKVLNEVCPDDLRVSIPAAKLQPILKWKKHSNYKPEIEIINRKLHYDVAQLEGVSGIKAETGGCIEPSQSLTLIFQQALWKPDCWIAEPLRTICISNLLQGMRVEVSVGRDLAPSVIECISSEWESAAKG